MLAVFTFEKKNGVGSKGRRISEHGLARVPVITVFIVSEPRLLLPGPVQGLGDVWYSICLNLAVYVKSLSPCAFIKVISITFIASVGRGNYTT